MTVYEIRMAEYQRKIIAIALKNLPFEAIAHIKLPSYEDGPAETILSLSQMIEELPQIEAEHPGTVHGLCL
ncbi:hypothetical protein D3C75_396330 [compost metagenome]